MSNETFFVFAGEDYKISNGFEYKADRWVGWVKANRPKHDLHVKMHLLLKCQAELKETFYPSAHAYDAAKDQIRNLKAYISGQEAYHIDPMGFWFGANSN